MLVVPMRNHDDEIVGVIELINKKQAHAKLRTSEITERTVISFGPEDEEVLNAFASQAAVALDNRLLIDSNLDWGQDLLYLKTWLDDHPARLREVLLRALASLPNPLASGLSAKAAGPRSPAC